MHSVGRLITISAVLSVLALISFATPVSVTNTALQAKSGELSNIYFETVVGPGSSTPSTNTAQSPSSGTGQYSVTRGSTAYLWSPQFGSGAAISAGTWVLDLWASGSSSGTMSVSILTTDSTGVVQSTIANPVATPTIGASKTQVVIRVSSGSANVPSLGYIEVTLYAPTGSSRPTSFIVYWGSGQQTDFQAPMVTLA